MVLISYAGSGGICVVGWLVWGGYNSLFHLGCLFTVVLRGVGGAVCMWYCVICEFSSIDLIVSS